MTQYYVDATGGLDTNDGLTPATAWKTVAKVNTSMGSFGAGDEVLFKYGETFQGATLLITDEGISGNPLKFGAYGVPADGYPIIDGQDTRNAVSITSRGWITIERIYAYQGLDFGFVFEDCHDIVLKDFEASDCGNDNILISNCVRVKVQGGRSHDAYDRLGTYVATCLEVKDNCVDIEVSGVEAYSSMENGIALVSHAGESFPQNVIINGCYCHDNTQVGIYLLKQNNAAQSDRGICISGCSSIDNGAQGVYANSTVAPLIRGLTIQDCYLEGNVANSLNLADVQDGVIKNNVIVAGDASQIILAGCLSIVVYNNTIRMNKDNFFVGVGVTGAATDGITVKNNIFFVDLDASNKPFMITVAAGASTNFSSDYNLFQSPANLATLTRFQWLGVSKNFADWKTSSSGDANSMINQDPVFRNYPDNDYRLMATSPARLAGVDVGLPYRNSTPDIGYREYISMNPARFILDQ